jgi:hypothetical protein
VDSNRARARISVRQWRPDVVEPRARAGAAPGKSEQFLIPAPHPKLPSSASLVIRGAGN